MDKVLFFHTWGIGDWVMYSPIIRSLIAANPNVEIDVIVSDQKVGSFVNKYPNCRVVGYLNTRRRIEMFAKTFSLLKSLSTYDAVIFAPGMNSRKADIISGFIKAKWKVALKVKGHRRAIFLNLVGEYDGAATQVENGLKISNLLGIPIWESVFVPSVVAQRRKEKSILIHPGCDRHNLYKRWPIENYIALAKKLATEGFSLGFILGPSETELEDSLGRIKDQVVIYKELDFSNVINVISSYETFINNDSGLGHIAAGVGTPICSLFGPTDPTLYKPYTPALKVVQSVETLICRPCYNKSPNNFGCEAKPCMTGISVEQVIAAVKELRKVQEV